MFLRRPIFVTALLLSLCTTSAAYDMGGHHYTLNAIFSSGNPPPVTHAAAEQLIQAFCAELPDLSLELDAITQRNHVLFDPKELLWGARGRCNTAGCAHMVASQFYLHALTGADTAPVRSAAENIVRAIDAELAATRAAHPADMSQQLVNLWCERGFAAHLLADTFAHSVLANPQKLYPTGLGHTRDMHEPDFMLARDDLAMSPTTRWSAWVQSAAANLSDAQFAAPVIKLAEAVASKDSDDHGEKILQSKLLSYTAAEWNAYTPALPDWNKPSTPSTKWWIFGRMEDAYTQVILQNSCQSQLARFASQVNLSSLGNKVPQCDAVWAGYRDRAMEQFSKQAIQPDCCDADVLRQDKLEYGCHSGQCN